MSEKINFGKPKIQNCSTHPHNIFFQLLSETGLIGIIYYIIFNIFLFIETFKFLFNKNYDQVNFFFLLPVIYYLNPIFPSGNFFNNWYMCFGILGLPFYLYLVRIKKSD
jgi:O-antigen ligase